MTWCKHILDCDTAKDYRRDVENEQNSTEREILRREYIKDCQENHENCEIRKLQVEGKKTRKKIYITEKRLGNHKLRKPIKIES
jgi:hypothetical protein